MNFKLALTVQYWKDIGSILWNSINAFFDDRCFKKSASLAYYTVFSIGPLLIIVIWLLGFLYGNHLSKSTAEDEVLHEVSKIFGNQVTDQIKFYLTKITFENKSKIALTIGFITLILTSTTLFVDMQDSINSIWKIRPKPKKNWLKLLVNRLMSFVVILTLGLLLIASLILNGIIVSVANKIISYLPFLPLTLISWVNTGITFLVIICLFTFIFSFLPDAIVRFKDVFLGALFTSVLFMLGRYGISLYLGLTTTATFYGAAGSLIILLLWIYYSAAILYFGAEYTRFHAEKFGRKIKPGNNAVQMETY